MFSREILNTQTEPLKFKYGLMVWLAIIVTAFYFYVDIYPRFMMLFFIGWAIFMLAWLYRKAKRLTETGISGTR